MKLSRGRKTFPFTAALLLVPWLFLVAGPSAYPLGPGSAVIVNDAGDTDDGLCDATHCTLREAIDAVFNDSNMSAINFSLPGPFPLISLTAPLPPLQSSMNIGFDLGTSQKIVLNGTAVGGIGFRVTAGNIIIKNFVIQNFDIGIKVEGDGRLRLGSSFIGTNETGNAPAPNRIGVALFTSHNSVGKSFLSGTQITAGNPIDPMLGPLQNNGGPTDTHEIFPGSPALDSGEDANCPGEDQRGVVRPLGGKCDIGAFEEGCGDSTKETNEECDDGNNIDDDGCSSICKTESAGNPNSNTPSSGGCHLMDQTPSVQGLGVILIWIMSFLGWTSIRRRLQRR